MSLWNGKSVRIDDVAFAQRAAAYFKANPNKHTFTDGAIKLGEPLAIKWASDGERVFSVAVVQISDAVLVEIA